MSNIIEYKKYIIVVQDNIAKFILNTKTNEMFSSNKTVCQIEEEIDGIVCDTYTDTDEVTSEQEDYKREVKNITVGMADRCNLKCTYCYANEGTYNNAEKSVISDDVLERIDQIIWDLSSGGVRSIHYFGGEPLLASDKIFNFCKRLVSEYKKESAQLPKFSITTNGTLLSADIVQKMKEYDFTVCVSLDGPKEIHDACRMSKDGRGSFDQVMEGIQRLRQKKMFFAVEAPIVSELFDSWNKNQLYQYFQFFIDIGANWTGFFSDVNEEMLSTQNGEKLKTIKNFYSAMVDFYFERLLDENSTIPFISNVYSVLISLLSNNQAKMCGAGINQIYLTPNGEIYPCQAYYATNASYMGNISDMDKFWEKHYKVSLDYPNRTPELCVDCIYFRYCEAKCPGSGLLVTKKENGITPIRCESAKIIIHRVLENMARIGNNEGLMSIFSKRFSQAVEIRRSMEF